MLANPRTRAIAAGIGLVILAAIYTQFVLPGPKGAAGRGTPVAILFQFALLGLLTGLVACGLVLVYRVQQFINFAGGAVGAIAAVFGVYLLRLTPTPFYVVVPATIIVGALLGAAFELVFIRRFFNAPRLTVTVVTVIAITSLFGVLISLIIKLPFFPRLSSIDPALLQGPIGPRLPFPGFHFTLGHLDLKFGFGAVFAVWTTVLCLAGLGFFFRYTRSGTAVRALAENPDRAELLGISTRQLSTIVWVVVGVLGAATAMASAFLDLGTSTQTFSTDQLLVPLVAAVVARMRSFVAALVTAVVLTVLQGAITWSYPGSDSAVTATFFVIVCVALFLQRRTLLRSEAQSGGGWASTEEVRPIPAELAGVSTVRRTRQAMIGVAILLVGLFPFFFSTRLSTFAADTIVLSIVALSLVVLTGWAGQISLGQIGFVAVGALVGGCLMTKVGLPWWLAIPVTSAFTGVVALIIGIPALRIKGLFLAAVTFGFAVAVNQFLFDPRYVKWLQPTAISRPRLFFLDFSDQRSMYYLSLAGLLIAVVVVLNLRRSRFGRVLIAMRDNEAALQAVGVSVVRTKLTAFVVSGALAGYAGILYAILQRGVSAGDYTSLGSLNLFVFTIIGGITSVAGALLGQVLSFTLTRASVNNQIFQLFGAFIPLAIVYAFPGGLMAILQFVRDGFLRIVAQRRQIIVPSLFADYDPETLQRQLIPLTPAAEAGASAVPAGTTFRRTTLLYRSGPASSGKGELGRAREAAAFGAAANSAAELETVGADVQ